MGMNNSDHAECPNMRKIACDSKLTYYAILKKGFSFRSTLPVHDWGKLNLLYSALSLSQKYSLPHCLHLKFFYNSRELTLPVLTTVPNIMINLLRCREFSSLMLSASTSRVGGTLMNLMSSLVFVRRAPSWRLSLERFVDARSWHYMNRYFKIASSSSGSSWNIPPKAGYLYISSIMLEKRMVNIRGHLIDDYVIVNVLVFGP